MSARDRYHPRMFTPGPRLYGYVELHNDTFAAMLAEIDDLHTIRVERDTLTAENAELRAKWERLTTALVKWKIDRRRIDWDDVVPADNWGIALREEGKQ